jgi:hypothetical protein
MITLWRRHPWSMTGFLLAATVTLFFLVRFAVHAIYWSDPAHRNMTPQPWMTVGFIAQSWDLDPVVIDEKAGLPLPQEGRGPLTLQEIARQRGVPVQEIITQVEAVILTLQAQEPPK